eukprot:c14599_g1_i1.p2 GENE.c14599_g1_i1~~c14599_g1_i1.p2  ORF type:complete len:403 (+),score=72.09 c14599_g1_i1:28-1209(+)
MSAAFWRYFKNFDAYPKTASEFRESTRSGGCATIIAALFVMWLVAMELMSFLDTKTVYDANIDTERSANQRALLNFDLTIASRCEHISADVIDAAGSHMGQAEHTLMRQPVSWSVTPPDETKVNSFWKDASQAMRESLRSILAAFDTAPEGEDSVEAAGTFAALAKQFGLAPEHAVKGTSERLPIVKTSAQVTALPQVINDDVSQASAEMNSCRIYGTLPIAKVQGNFHITAGRSVDMNGMHGHDLSTVPLGSLNFTHKIHRLSFGENFVGLASPLDAIVQHTTSPGMQYFYVLKIVPTLYSETSWGYNTKVNTNQYAATFRPVVLSDSMRALPGLFFSYNFEAVRVVVHETSMPFAHLLTRMLAILGGVLAFSKTIVSWWHLTGDVIGNLLS